MTSHITVCILPQFHLLILFFPVLLISLYSTSFFPFTWVLIIQHFTQSPSVVLPRGLGISQHSRPSPVGFMIARRKPNLISKLCLMQYKSIYSIYTTLWCRGIKVFCVVSCQDMLTMDIKAQMLT